MSPFRLRGLLLVVLVSLALLVPSAGAVSTSLVINEVDYDQASTDTAEFLELKNVSGSAISLAGFTVELVNGTGGGASIYRTIALPSTTLAAGDYFVICSNPATTLNCDLDGGPDTDFIQNGAPDAIGLRSGGTLVDALSYEGDSGAPYTEGSGAGLVDDPNAGTAGLSRCADGSDTDQNNTDFAYRPSTPGVANNCPPPPVQFGVCGDDQETRIHAIQGSGPASDAVGATRVIEGIVVGDFQGSGALNGYFVQEEDADADVDPQTSEGIFVSHPGSSPVASGDAVRVRGTVAEFFGLTQLGGVTDLAVCSNGGSVTAASAGLPTPSLNSFEAFEGMRTTFSQTLTATETFTLGRFGEVALAAGGRLFTPTQIVDPGAPAMAEQDLNRRSQIQLDDGSSVQNPPIVPYLGLDDTLRIGDTVPGVTGVLSFGFGVYELHPTEAVTFTRANPRPTGPPEVDGSLRVGAANVLNYFTTLDGSGPICGPQANQDCRGADSATELERQRAKLVAALTKLDADIVGLTELENNASDAPIADLVAGLNDATAAGTYAYVATGAVGTDAIRVGIVYKPAAVTPVGNFAVLDSTVDPLFLDQKNRPVLAQSFRENGTEDVLTVAVNHLKSKGSDCNDVGDPDTGDGQGNCNVTRANAATALVNWLATDPTDSGSEDVLVIGDLNSYAKEDPIGVIEDAGYTNLVDSFVGDDAYSFVFQAQSGTLDYALASPSLTARVTGADEYHINADEPVILDYNTEFNPPSLFSPDEFRAADHDPVLVGLCEATPPALSVSLSPSSLWPPNHTYVTVQATLAASDKSAPAVTLVSAVSNEPDNAPGQADGNTTDDVVVVDQDTFRLRAERDETGSGRIYTVTYRATDACGNSTTRTATVTVPVSR